jgi:hypothetical protein
MNMPNDVPAREKDYKKQEHKVGQILVMKRDTGYSKFREVHGL